MLGLLAKKVGMTQIFDDVGRLVPVTVLRIDPNIVIAQKNEEKNGYAAVVLGVDDIKPARVTKPIRDNFQNRLPLRNILKNFVILIKKLL